MADITMTPRTIDAYMEGLVKDSNIQEPKEGEPVVGYRLFYEYKDALYPPIVGSPRHKETGVKHYAPITYVADHPDTLIEGKEWIRGYSKGVPYDAETEAGFYYWPTLPLAQAFLSQLREAFDGEQDKYVVINPAGKISATLDRPYNKNGYHTEETEGFGKLVIYKVQGTAGKNIRGDGGYVMQDIFIPQWAEPEEEGETDD